MNHYSMGLGINGYKMDKYIIKFNLVYDSKKQCTMGKQNNISKRIS